MIDLHNALIAGRMIGGSGGTPPPEPVLIEKTVTANGTYNAASDNVDGYSGVTVNVEDIKSMDKMLLANGGTPISTCVYHSLTAADTDVTCYAVMAAPISAQNNNAVYMMCAPYAATSECVPGFFSNNYTNQVYAAFHGRDVELSGVTCDVYHVYTMSINAAQKQAKFYVDGVLKYTDSMYSHSGNVIIIGSLNFTMTDLAGRRVQCKYFGVVESLQSDADIIMHQQELMAKYGIN